MARCRIFTNPDGSVRIMRPNLRRYDPKRETLSAYTQRILDQDSQKDTSVAELAFVDLDDSQLPADRSNRHKWRLKKVAGQDRVEVDLAAPDPPDPRQPLLDQINAANTVGELKAALLKVVKP